MLRLYPRLYRERFGEAIEQTFNDLLRERAAEDKRVSGFALWMFTDTVAAIIREHLTVITMRKYIVRPALVTAILLLIPFFGNLYVDGWNWPWPAFVFVGTILFGACVAYEAIVRRMKNKAYRFAIGFAIVIALVFTWSGWVGGADGNPASQLLWGVVSVGLAGALISGLKPRGMAYTMFAMAIAQMLVPVIVLMVLNSDSRHLQYTPLPALLAPSVAGLFGVNAFFALLFVGCGFLFRRASVSSPNAERTA
ncbi:MAG: hypothetical protein ACRD3J_05240 [Thermoanaerobaculia bacterium]